MNSKVCHFNHFKYKIQLFLYLKIFLFGNNSNLQKNCENTTKNTHIFFIQVYFLLTFHSICFYHLFFVYTYISINVYMYVYVVCVCVYFFLMNCCIYAGSLPLNNTHFLRIKYSLIKPQYIYYFQIFNIHIILLICFPYSNFVNYSIISLFFFFPFDSEFLRIVLHIANVIFFALSLFKIFYAIKKIYFHMSKSSAFISSSSLFITPS